MVCRWRLATNACVVSHGLIMVECQQKRQKKGPPKIFPSIRAMKKLATFSRINFSRTLEINQKLAVTWGPVSSVAF